MKIIYLLLLLQLSFPQNLKETFFKGVSGNQDSKAFVGFYSPDRKVRIGDQNNYNQAIKYYNSKRFSKAKQYFELVIMENPGSLDALNAQYYMGDCLYELKEYENAYSIFSEFVRFSNNYDLVRSSHYKICLCVKNLSGEYYNDQYKIKEAINQFQYFIDLYPNSDELKEVNKQIADLKMKLAKKMYESARLYLKLKKYDSARKYFKQVINIYYDKEFSEIYDKSHIMIMRSYILSNELSKAKEYFDNHKDDFKIKKNLAIAKDICNRKNNKKNMMDYYHLFR